MKSLKIIVKKLEEKGIKDAEKIVMDVFACIEESLPAIAVDPETSSIEKGSVLVLGPVLATLKPAIEKLADFNHDGKIG
jgi:hypothetical protein